MDPPPPQGTSSSSSGAPGAPLPSAVQLGQVVDVRGYGRAEVVELPSGTDRYPDRVRVRYPDGKSYWCRPESLRQIRPASRRVLVCGTTREYRTAAVQNVGPSDVCLEVGCHQGVTTSLVHARCRAVVGIDRSPETVAAARAKHPHVRFEVADGSDVATLRTLCPVPPPPLEPNGSSPSQQPAGGAPPVAPSSSPVAGTTGAPPFGGEAQGAEGGDGYDVILVDIGGVAELPVVAELVLTLYREFKGALLIVKSVFLQRMLRDCEIFVAGGAARNWGDLEGGVLGVPRCVGGGGGVGGAEGRAEGEGDRRVDGEDDDGEGF